jgi:hypothetical protein
MTGFDMFLNLSKLSLNQALFYKQQQSGKKEFQPINLNDYFHFKLYLFL